MSEGLDYDCCLRVGFLNDRQDRLPIYLDRFDVVIIGDPEMDVVLHLLDSVCVA